MHGDPSLIDELAKSAQLEDNGRSLKRRFDAPLLNTASSKSTAIRPENSPIGL
jgi:hypothetical protein